MGGGMVAEKRSVCRLSGQLPQNAADVRQEAHVEHPIRFVQHEDLQPVQPRVRILQMVQEPSRCRHQHVDAAPERVFLGLHADASEDGGALDPSVPRQLIPVLVDLRRELPGGREHERTGDATPAA